MQQSIDPCIVNSFFLITPGNEVIKMFAVAAAILYLADAPFPVFVVIWMIYIIGLALESMFR